MRIVYQGLFDEVIVADWLDARGYPQNARRGEPVEVPEELALRLLEQEANWAKAPASPGRKTGLGAAESAGTEG